MEFETQDGLLSIASATYAIAQEILRKPLEHGLRMPDEVIDSWDVIKEDYERTLKSLVAK